MKSRIWLFLIAAALCTGCAHAGSKPALSFQVAVPEGWKRIHTDESMLFITKEGGYKQFVLIAERPLSQPFRFSQRRMHAGTMPEEAAEIIVQELLSDTHIRNVTLLENAPARIDGRQGFRLRFVYTDADGFLFKTLYFGFIDGATFYNIRFAATQEEIYQKDLATFEKVFASFKLLSAKAP
jgi:hypothetical protein